MSEWERVTSMGRTVYWHRPVTEMLRASVKRIDPSTWAWAVHVRDEPRYAWHRAEEGTARSFPAAKREAEQALRTQVKP